MTILTANFDCKFPFINVNQLQTLVWFGFRVVRVAVCRRSSQATHHPWPCSAPGHPRSLSQRFGAWEDGPHCHCPTRTTTFTNFHRQISRWPRGLCWVTQVRINRSKVSDLHKFAKPHEQDIEPGSSWAQQNFFFKGDHPWYQLP